MAKLKLPHWLRRYEVKATPRGWMDARTKELYVSRRMKAEDIEEWEGENNKAASDALKAHNEAALAKPPEPAAEMPPLLAQLKSGEVDIGDYTDNLYSKTKAELLDEASAVGYEEAKPAQTKDEILDGLIGYLSDIID